MCGICGFCGFTDEKAINRMNYTLHLRGPDDSGTASFCKDKVSFGHRRLSILDLSQAGHQPMSNSKKTVWITYNGEIYNFQEIRKELKEKGIVFKSQTDTEVILAGYEIYGEKIIPRLDGIFAFSIYDKEKRKVLLVRDHIGVKPLYYSYLNGKFIFGSEIKAILASGQISVEINEQALWDYLTFLYIPCPNTMYKNIFQLQAAHYLTFDLKTSEYSINKYWNPIENLGNKLTDREEIAYLLRKTLSRTVSEQMVSDVPIGAFLSGGIDSNIIVALMARYSSKKVRTFTAIFSDDEAQNFNESVAAGRVAKKFDTIHEEIEIPTPKLEDIFSMLSWTDQPFGNPTLFLSYLVSKKLKNHVTVALSGSGGDELFGGYVRYKHFNMMRKILKRIPVDFSPLAKPAAKLSSSFLSAENGLRVFKFFHGLTPIIAQHYLRWAYFLDDYQKVNFVYNSNMMLQSRRILESLFEEAISLNDQINILEYVDLLSYLRDDILEYTDKSSMAASLEVRVPFLSPKMIELSLRIPGKFKIRHGKTKVSLIDSFKSCIPKENLNLPKKGFSAPSIIWSQNFDKHFDRLEEKLSSNCMLNFEEINRIRKEHRAGRFNHGQILFGILMLEIWLANTFYS